MGQADVPALIQRAWDRLARAILSDPGELKARLARRRTRVFLSVTRAWCVAIRASDSRIHPWSAAIVPEAAAGGGWRARRRGGRGMDLSC